MSAREIKFRAWGKESKKMFECVTVGCDREKNKWPLTVVLNPPYVGGLHEPYEVMQYTGLKDKNGKEIYEGDIVKISDHPFDGSNTVNGNYEVGYKETMELCCGSWLLFRMKPYAEIIGNIYENPELLGGAK